MCEKKKKNNKNGETNLQSFHLSLFHTIIYKAFTQVYVSIGEQSSCLIIIELKDIKFICVQCPK